MRIPLAKPNIIQSDLYQANQSWCLDRIYGLGQHRIRVKLRRNAYDEQSFGVAESWHCSGWQQIVFRPISLLHCKSASYTSREAPSATFDKDAENFYQMAVAVLITPV